MVRLKKHWKPLLGVAAAGLLPLLVLFWPTLGMDRLYYGHDIGLQQIALTAQAKESLAAGEIPFWNQRMFAGTPLLAPANAGVLSPLWLLTSWLPLAPSFTVHAVLSLWLAYAGAAWCAWRRTGSVGAAILAGYVFMLGAPIFLRTFAGHTTILGCQWALPWMFAAGDALLERPRGSQLALLAVTTAILVVGNPHLAMLAVLTFAAAAAGRAAWRWWFDRDTTRWATTLGWIAVGGALGVALAAPQLLPGLEFAAHSTRSGGLDLTIAKSTSAGLNHLPYFFFPTFYGDPAFGPNNVLAPPPTSGADIDAPTMWEVCGFVGLIALTMAGTAWSVWRGRTYGVLAAGSLALALAHHTPLYTIAFYVIPKFDLLRTPGRWLIITTLALAMCAAEGFALLTRDDTLGQLARRRLRWVAGGVALLAITSAIAATGIPYGLDKTAPTAGVPAVSYLGLLLPLALLGTLATLYASGAELAKSLTPGLVLVALGELLVFIAPFVSVQRMSSWRYPRPIAQAAERVGASDEWRFDVAPMASPDWLRGNHPLMHGHRSAGGYDPAALRHYLHLYNTVQRHKPSRLTWNALTIVPDKSKGGTWHPLLPLLQMRYLVSKYPEERMPAPMRLIAAEAGVALYEYPHALPRAYVVHMTRVADDATRETELAPLALLQSPDFVLREEAVVSAGGPALNAAPPEAPEPVTVVSETPQRLVLDADVQADGFLVLLDTWYPGWSCTIDGVETPVHRTNHAYRGVSVTAGRHEVVFTYTCAPFRTGVGVALGALIGLAGAGWFLRRREDEHTDTIGDDSNTDGAPDAE